MRANDPLKIQHYGIIGDCRAAALVGRNGSIDWLCWPQFDSAAIFAHLLDPECGGRWQIAPSTEFHANRRYAGHTNVLETTFITPTGSALLIDLMPVASEEYKRKVLFADHEILREVRCLDGEVELDVLLRPRADYGRSAVQVHERGKLGVRMEVGRGVYWFRSTHDLKVESDAVRGRLRLAAGQKAQFTFSYTQEAPAVLCCLGDGATERIEISKQWWEQWAARAVYNGPYADAVIRSALTLKLLTYAPSGAVIAAATTSLPERVGANLNWDYRYCWLRDAALTMRGLLGLGYWDEAQAFMEWLLHATRLTQPRLRILYTVFGENSPAERELDYLSGYRDSRPVRVGNGARNQLQLDVYGEVVDAAAQIAFHGHEFDHVTQKVLCRIGEYVANNWRQPDEGIWEPRSGRQNHTHSRLLCWTALDRLCTLAARGSLKGAPVSKFSAERDAIVNDIRNNGWNERLHSYVSAYGGDDLDASLLLMSWYGFERADDARMQATYRAIDRNLRAGPGLLYRYRTDPPEGAFGICSFWDAEYLAFGGASHREAERAFEKLVSYANDLGLFAEEIDPAGGDALGNFPQAFTHVGLISAALSLQERSAGQQMLAHREPSAEANAQEAVR